MKNNLNLEELLLDTWKTTNQVTLHLIKAIDAKIWNKNIPGYSRKSISDLSVHLHNVRCGWIRQIANRKFVVIPARISGDKPTKKEVLNALTKSNQAMLALFGECLAIGGKLPSRPSWLNFPADIMHLLTYFVAHEAHHRGQIVMAARQLGHTFTREQSGELWQWNKRLREAKKT